MAMKRKMSIAVSKTMFQRNVNKINSMNFAKNHQQSGYRM